MTIDFSTRMANLYYELLKRKIVVDPDIREIKPRFNILSESNVDLALYLARRSWHRIARWLGLTKKYAKVELDGGSNLFSACANFLYGENILPLEFGTTYEFKGADALIFSMALAFISAFEFTEILCYEGDKCWMRIFPYAKRLELKGLKKQFADILLKKKNEIEHVNRSNFLVYEFANAISGLCKGKMKNITSFDIMNFFIYGVPIQWIPIIHIPKSEIARQIIETTLFMDIIKAGDGPRSFIYNPSPIDRLHQYIYLKRLNNFSPNNMLTFLLMEIVKRNLRLGIGKALEKSLKEIKDLVDKLDPRGIAVLAAVLATKEQLVFVKGKDGTYTLLDFGKEGHNQTEYIRHMAQRFMELRTSEEEMEWPVAATLIPIWYTMKYHSMDNVFALCDELDFITSPFVTADVAHSIVTTVLMAIDSLVGSSYTAIPLTNKWFNPTEGV